MSKNIESEYIKSETRTIMESLKEAIKNSDIPIGDIAFAADVTTNQLYKYLNGTTVMPFDRFVAIIDIIGVNKSYVILGDTVDKNARLFQGEDILMEIKNLKVRIENEMSDYTEEDKKKFIKYILELGLLLNQ